MRFFIWVVLVTAAIPTLSGELAPCPTWYHNVSSGWCECNGGPVKCELKGRVRISSFYCMTYDNTSHKTSVGACPFSKGTTLDDLTRELPRDRNELNNFTCGRLGRQGLLCSHCKESLGVAVLSYKYECTKCLGYLKGWLLYSVLALLPITIFFLIVIFCNIRAAAAHMNAVICISQLILFGLDFTPLSITGSDYYLILLGVTIGAIWNLDFFRYFYPSFCISQHYSTLSVISFEYIIAFYPLVLVFLTYISIELYDRDYAVMQFLLKPFKWCSSVLHRKNWKFISYNSINAKSNIISAFATFIVLAYSKILYTCCVLFSANNSMWNSDINGSVISSYYLKFNASIHVHYNSAEHKPYLILSVSVLIIFNLLPIILLFVYPIKIFQRGLNSISCVNWHYLHTFMDCFQGCYKNGTENTRDYRYFAGIYLLIRLTYQIPGVIDMNHKNYYSNVLVPYLASLLFGIFRPYRVSFYNRLDCAYFGLLTLGRLWLLTGKVVTPLPLEVAVLTGFVIVIHTFIVFGYGVYINLRPKKRK